MTKVIAFGTFDIVHPGHLFFLKEAKKLGDFLVVVIARDQTVARLKKHPTKNNETARLSQVTSFGVADKVVLGSLTDIFEVVRQENPDIVALGYDQTFFTDELSNNIHSKTKIVRLPSFKPDIFKSSKLS